jgi:hypothetical protein
MAVAVAVRELLAQAERKARLDAAGRVDTVFQAGDRALLRAAELLDAADSDIGKLRRPRWDGPFTVTACQSPKAYTLRVALPRRMRCSPTVNVGRIRPFFERGGRGGRSRLKGR